MSAGRVAVAVPNVCGFDSVVGYAWNSMELSADKFVIVYMLLTSIKEGLGGGLKPHL